MNTVRPELDDFGNLEVTFGKSKQSFWQVLNDFARNRSNRSVISILALAVCGVASAFVNNALAAAAIVAMVLGFSLFVIIYGEEKYSTDELRDESTGS